MINKKEIKILFLIVANCKISLATLKQAKNI